MDSTDNAAVVTIADEGSGIPVEHRQHIFDRFFRLDAARSRDSGGTGLGLAIAKWAIEAHGGRITVGDGPTGGAVFRIMMPTRDGFPGSSSEAVIQSLGEQS